MIDFFLQKSLSRLGILKTNFVTPLQKNIHIHVYRNHAFESMEAQ